MYFEDSKDSRNVNLPQQLPHQTHIPDLKAASFHGSTSYDASKHLLGHATRQRCMFKWGSTKVQQTCARLSDWVAGGNSSCFLRIVQVPHATHGLRLHVMHNLDKGQSSSARVRTCKGFVQNAIVETLQNLFAFRQVAQVRLWMFEKVELPQDKMTASNSNISDFHLNRSPRVASQRFDWINQIIGALSASSKWHDGFSEKELKSLSSKFTDMPACTWATSQATAKLCTGNEACWSRRILVLNEALNCEAASLLQILPVWSWVHTM